MLTLYILLVWHDAQKWDYESFVITNITRWPIKGFINLQKHNVKLLHSIYLHFIQTAKSVL